ncbi:hypothetical protein AVENP_0772 [Arcobacter venerupis]|uniref:Uncharacterized protein n=1 Tax=Arcobacter venerupis TaxID=1054033 RepID=A0AAE7B9M9_9BACT|nr:hypothetical protein [Arcobacter venerupis]QKF66332.1 hypothetical protein AVENP_0772 [Arcobacter venerupis]RWS50886.1 hypothetical protein CKA56_00690 [Arcobacter venerupis]
MTPIDYIKENHLEWQPSFSREINNALFGYRGALIIQEGKKLSETKVMPPKAQAKQVIMISEADKIKFFACELETFGFFEEFFNKYKDFFDANSVNLLYVIDLDANGVFEYQGVKFSTFMLDESSVWNEVLDYFSLEKGVLKKLSNEEKLEMIYDELATMNVEAIDKTYDEMLALMGTTKKSLMGAV